MRLDRDIRYRILPPSWNPNTINRGQPMSLVSEIEWQDVNGVEIRAGDKLRNPLNEPPVVDVLADENGRLYLEDMDTPFNVTPPASDSEIISFEDRLARIKDVRDLDKEIILAGRYAKALRTRSKSLPTLKEKLAAGERVKRARAVEQELKLKYFDIQDMLQDRASK